MADFANLQMLKLPLVMANEDVQLEHSHAASRGDASIGRYVGGIGLLVVQVLVIATRLKIV